MLHVLYTCSTPTKLGKITYSKIAHTLYVFLYSSTLLFSLSYKNSALGFPKVAIGTVGIKSGRRPEDR